MRIVKEAEERRNEILDVAERLFVSKGFDQTSTNDILHEIGIARGTLYYHFKSKEDILDAMIDRITEQLIKKAEGIFCQKEVPVLQRFPMMIQALHVDSPIGNEIMELVHKPQNALMHQKMQEKQLCKVTFLLVELIKEGMEQGIFQTDYPTEAVEMALLYSNTVFDAFAEYSEEVRGRKTEAFIYNLERLLGMESGGMQASILPVFQKTTDSGSM